MYVYIEGLEFSARSDREYAILGLYGDYIPGTIVSPSLVSAGV